MGLIEIVSPFGLGYREMNVGHNLPDIEKYGYTTYKESNKIWIRKAYREEGKSYDSILKIVETIDVDNFRESKSYDFILKYTDSEYSKTSKEMFSHISFDKIIEYINQKVRNNPNQYEKYYKELVVTDFPSRLPLNQFLSCYQKSFLSPLR